MNNFIFGTSNISNLYFGNSQISKIYFGNSLIWQKDTAVYLTDSNDNYLITSDNLTLTVLGATNT